jgi:L-lactate oxidase
VTQARLRPRQRGQINRHFISYAALPGRCGRAFDGVQATITALPRIADAVQGRLPIILDSGVRRGTDVFKALALGANVVACGRPVLYGLALGGSLGVQSVLEYMRDNLALVMRLAGTSSIKDISRDNLAPHVA